MVHCLDETDFFSTPIMCLGKTIQFYFLGLPDKKLYPSVSAVYGNTEVSMVYLGPPLDG